MERERVVVTGLGLITPIGNDRAAVISRLRDLKHGLERVEWFKDCPVRVAGTIKDFDLESMNQAAWRWPARHTIPRETLRSMSPHVLYAYCAIEQAIADASLTRKDVADEATGLFCASAGSPRFLTHHMNEGRASACRRVHPWSVVRSIAGTLNYNLAANFGIRGPVTGFVSACASSGHAIGYAFDEIALGRQKRMIVVGAEEPFWESLMPFDGLRALSRQEDPVMASRPFDLDRDGFVGSGGAAVLILESAHSAGARGARAQAELLGWGQSSDGHGVAQPEPEGRGIEAAMRRALHASGVASGEIDYVNAHATGTQAGDRAEAKALLRLFGSGDMPVSSTKALTGHTLSMATALEAALCTLALTEGFIPGQAHLRARDPEFAGLNFPETTLPTAPRTVMTNSSGFGGSNVAIVLRRV